VAGQIAFVENLTSHANAAREQVRALEAELTRLKKAKKRTSPRRNSGDYFHRSTRTGCRASTRDRLASSKPSLRACSKNSARPRSWSRTSTRTWHPQGREEAVRLQAEPHECRSGIGGPNGGGMSSSTIGIICTFALVNQLSQSELRNSGRLANSRRSIKCLSQFVLRRIPPFAHYHQRSPILHAFSRSCRYTSSTSKFASPLNTVSCRRAWSAIAL
jgi:hypothetical protein